MSIHISQPLTAEQASELLCKIGIIVLMTIEMVEDSIIAGSVKNEYRDEASNCNAAATRLFDDGDYVALAQLHKHAMRIYAKADYQVNMVSTPVTIGRHSIPRKS